MELKLGEGHAQVLHKVAKQVAKVDSHRKINILLMPLERGAYHYADESPVEEILCLYYETTHIHIGNLQLVVEHGRSLTAQWQGI